MIKRLGVYIILPILFGFLMFLYGFSRGRNQEKKIKDIEVEFTVGSNPFLTHQTVNKLLIQNEETVKNQSKSVVDLHRLETELLSNPYVEEASVFITLEGLLKAYIKQREPVARIISDDDVYYVDKFGKKFPLSSNFSARVPLVKGISSTEDINQVVKFLAIISEDDFFKKELVSIQKVTTNDFVFNVRSGDYKIEFGAFENVSTKIKKLKAFYNKALLDNTIQEYKIVNVKYHNQVVCTKQNQDGK